MSLRALLVILALLVSSARAQENVDPGGRAAQEETARRRAMAAHAEAAAEQAKKEAVMRDEAARRAEEAKAADAGHDGADAEHEGADAEHVGADREQVGPVVEPASTRPAVEGATARTAAEAATTRPAAASTQPTTAQAATAEAIECVVIAKRLPDAPPQSGKPPQTFITIRVLQTIKGVDESGTDIRVLPKDLPPTNESYLFTYNRSPGFEWAEMTGAEPPSGPRVKAIQEQTKAAGGVLPKRALWARINKSPTEEQTEDFWVAPDGLFFFTRASALGAGPDKPQTVSGTISQATLKGLIPDAAPLNPVTSYDAGRVTLRWIDDDGAQHWKLLATNDPAGDDMLKRIEAIGDKQGAK